MIRQLVACAALCPLVLMADTLVLRSGQQVEGTYLGGDSRRVRLAVGDAIQNFNVTEISEIRFGPAEQAQAAAPARQRIELTRPENVLSPAPAPQAAASQAKATTIPEGTPLVIRMIDDVDSERDAVGQTFRASVDEPVTLNGEVVVPRGADVVIALAADKESGRLTGRSELTLDIASVKVGGRSLQVVTQEITQQSESRTAQTAKRAGGIAVLGAVIGAIAGGGKGAAIGAASGAAAGGAVQVLTKGPRVRIPSETRLSFTLQQPVKL